MAQWRRFNYAEYLDSQEWKERAQHMRVRFGERCQICNSDKGPLHVHHRTYERLGDEDSRDLTVLCHDCHTLFHEHGRLARFG